MQKTLLGIAILFAGLVANAEVKPAGTVLEMMSGSTNTFPSSTYVSVARVVGSDRQYLGLARLRSEIFAPSEEKIEVKYALIADVQYDGRDTTTYTTYVVKNGYETKVELVVTDQGGELRGSLKYNGEFIFGGQSFNMDYIMHTL